MLSTTNVWPAGTSNVTNPEELSFNVKSLNVSKGVTWEPDKSSVGATGGIGLTGGGAPTFLTRYPWTAQLTCMGLRNASRDMLMLTVPVRYERVAVSNA